MTECNLKIITTRFVFIVRDFFFQTSRQIVLQPYFSYVHTHLNHENNKSFFTNKIILGSSNDRETASESIHGCTVQQAIRAGVQGYKIQRFHSRISAFLCKLLPQSRFKLFTLNVYSSY